MNKGKLRAGFTVLELVIVLSILVILAGLVLQVMPNLLARTHLAQCSDTIAEINKAWNRSYVLNVRYPDAYDSLLDDTQAVSADLLSDHLIDQTAAATLNAGEVDALAAIGIRYLVDGAVDASNTFDYAPYGTASRLLVDTAPILELDLVEHLADGNELNLKRHLVREADGTFTDNSANTRYFVFGIGPNCTGVGPGKLIQEAPVHFAANDELNPASIYQRFLVIFSIVYDDDHDEYVAYFETAAGNDHHGPTSVGHHLEHFHEGSNNDG
ncbi:Hypothetical protein PBC10988_17740 [Planctomycetales bacterium 10988]|nr:Hypothetical protein PBC10988_17740 [Planctomycetales bacterium 10988]